MILNLTPNRKKIYHSPIKAEQLISRLNEILIKTKTATYFTHILTTQDLYNGTIDGNKFSIQRAFFGGAPIINGEIIPEENGSKIFLKVQPSFFFQFIYYISLFLPIAFLIFLVIKIPIFIFSPLVVFPLLTFIPFIIQQVSLSFLFTQNNFFLERWLIEDNIDQKKSNLHF